MLTFLHTILPPTFGAAALVYLALAFTILRPAGGMRDRATGYLLLFTGIYLAAMGLWYGATEVMLIRAGSALSTLSAGFLPVALYALYRGFTGQPIARWELVVLSIVPGMSFLLVLTNPLHVLAVPTDLQSGFYRFPNVGDRGWFGYLFLPYTYGLYSYSLFALVGRLSSLAKAHRRPVIGLIGCALLPACAWLMQPVSGLPVEVLPFAALVLTAALPLYVWVYKLMQSSDFRPIGFHTVFNHVQDAILIIDDSSRVVSVNAAAERLLDKQESDLVGSPLADRLPGVPITGAAAPDRQSATVQYEARYLDVSVAPLRDPSGASAGSVVIVRDTTERRNTQRRLADSEQLIRSLVEHSPNGILRFRPSGDDFICIFANPAAERFLKEVSRGVMDKPLEDLRILQPMSLRQLFHDARSQTPAAEQARDIEFEAGGRWLSLTVEPVGEDFSVTLVDVTQTKLAETRMIADAHHDALTGVLNRRGFESLAPKILDAAGTGAVIYLDLDAFKRVNDQYGHGAGDALLKAFSRRVEVCLGPDDIVVRLGGDEFAVILPTIETDDARQIATRVARSAAEPYVIDGKRISCTASLGLALKPSHGQTLSELLAQADRAMYAAKGSRQQEAANDGAGFAEAALAEPASASR